MDAINKKSKEEIDLHKIHNNLERIGKALSTGSQLVIESEETGEKRVTMLKFLEKKAS